MNPLFFVPFASTAKWVSAIADTTTDGSDIYDDDDAFFDSNDPDEIMSAFARGATIPCLDEDRMIAMMKLRPDVLRECIRMLVYFDEPPSCLFMIEAGELIFTDLTAAELLIEIWMVHDWDLTPEFVFAIQKSYSAWKFLHQYNYNGNDTSLDLINCIDESIGNSTVLSFIEAEDSNLKSCICAMIGTNGSVLEYLIYIDEHNGNGMKQTIATINKFDLWDIVLSNPAAPAIIDFACENPLLVHYGTFSTKRELMDWFIPQIEDSPYVERYLTIDDIKSDTVGGKFYTNPFAVGIIDQYLSEINDDAPFADKILYGLFSIASTEHKEESATAIRNIRKLICHETIHLINPEYFISLLQSPFGVDGALDILTEFNCSWKEGLIQMSDLVPYWTPTTGTEWELVNLTPETAKNIHLSIKFKRQSIELVDLLSYDDWMILLETEFGVELAFDHIGYIIDKGIAFKLFRSPFLDEDRIAQLFETTDICEYLGDDEYFSIVNRDDAFVINSRDVRSHNADLCYQILASYFEPSRLSRFSSNADMDLRTYLNTIF